MDKDKIKQIENDKPIPEQLLEDVIVTALEGGSNYWYFINEKNNAIIQKYKDKTPMGDCFSIAMTKAILKGESIEIHDFEDEKEKLGEINLESFKKALEIAQTSYSTAYANIVSEDYDDTDADIIFQLAVMGELVFG